MQYFPVVQEQAQAGNSDLGTHGPDAGQVDMPHVRMNPSVAVELHNGIFFLLFWRIFSQSYFSIVDAVLLMHFARFWMTSCHLAS